MYKYILDENNVPRQVDETTYFNWKRTHKGLCQVRRSGIYNGKLVSTVFIGIDKADRPFPSHAVYRPLLFETRVFSDNRCTSAGHPWHTSTWEEAVDMHDRGCVAAEGFWFWVLQRIKAHW